MKGLPVDWVAEKDNFLESGQESRLELARPRPTSTPPRPREILPSSTMYWVAMLLLLVLASACRPAPGDLSKTQEPRSLPIVTQEVDRNSSEATSQDGVVGRVPVATVRPDSTVVPAATEALDVSESRAHSRVAPANQYEGSDAFCSDKSVLELIDGLQDAVSNRDGDALAELIAPERGVRIRRHWWNPEVVYELDGVRTLFTSPERRAWGTADGSGKPIDGSFRDVILPLMDRNLLPATEYGCNQILHGGTAGLVQLPSSYEGSGFYSLHRPPGPDEFELDWGTWVVGFERWQGRYVVSYLVHYEWEI